MHLLSTTLLCSKILQRLQNLHAESFEARLASRSTDPFNAHIAPICSRLAPICPPAQDIVLPITEDGTEFLLH